jgi:hypothetical protein
MATETAARLGLSEQELRKLLGEELERALHAQGGEWAADVVAHSVARILHLDHLRMLEQLEAAGLRLETDGARREAR